MSRLRFGPFEFDADTRELSRDGANVRLQSQPAQVLGALLAHPGEVVTRASLQEALWGAETHVDFDNGLNFCMSQLRTALGDSAEAPVYIRTIPKRGYQFIAPVADSATFEARRDNRRWFLPAAIVAGVAALFAVSQFGAATAHRTRRIAVARFENQSGDTSLDRFGDGLSDALVAEFTSAFAGKFDIVGNAAVLRTFRDRQDLARIASEVRAEYVVIGQVQKSADKGRVLIHLIRASDQGHLWVTRADDPDFANSISTQRDIARRAAREFGAKLLD
jgi:DNA-binding winged helix-turn-helix (wHTH) protein/TolB-like protein